MIERLRVDLATYRRMRSGGVRAASLLLYPLRRRLPRPRTVLELKTGESFRAGPDEELLRMFEEIWIEESYLPPGWEPVSGCTVIDIGANIGVFSVWAARRLGAERIVAVEPAPDTAALLRANLDRNGIAASVLEAGLAARAGRAMLHRRGAPARDTTFISDRYGSVFERTAAVELVTLDEVFSRLETERCDLLKLDCEGCEYGALAGASPETLARIDRIAAEYHVGLDERGPDALSELLEHHGFEVAVLPQIDVEGGHLRARRRA